MPKEYIGDAVYADVENGALVLTTEDGFTGTNRIVIEPEVWAALLLYVDLLAKREPEQAAEPPTSYYCTKSELCARPNGHPGECDTIPF